MAPLIPRMHLFEIDDQPWFPPILRRVIQRTLLEAWSSTAPPLQNTAPAKKVADLLLKEFGPSISNYKFVDFCAGAGGPTPIITREINNNLASKNEPLVDFVLSDIHPNIPSWEEIAQHDPHITYEPESVDASKAPPQLVRRGEGKKLMRIFNLAFHHFDDKLANDILRNTVETSDGFAIFELQDRSFDSFIGIHLMLIVAVLAAPLYAIKWRSPAAFIFNWIIPIIPFVLWWDGHVSSLRTREPDEVEAMLRSCGADASKWEFKSGRDLHMWPVGYISWIICRPIEGSSK